MFDLISINPNSKEHLDKLYDLLSKREFNISHKDLPLIRI